MIDVDDIPGFRYEPWDDLSTIPRFWVRYVRTPIPYLGFRYVRCGPDTLPKF